jgi:hypothetical protein
LNGTPLAGQASNFVTDAQQGGINPLLLVAIADAESQLGVTAPPGTNNPFGLLKPVRVKLPNGTLGTKYVPYAYSSLNAAAQAAVLTIDHRFEAGFVTLALLYSGTPGSYCSGNCKDGYNNAYNEFVALGGGDPNNSVNLLWPCKD